MNWLKRHKDEILKLTIVTVLSTIIFNVVMAIFNWIVLNVPVLVIEGGSTLSAWWVAFANWGQETVSIEKTKFQILGGFIALLSVAMQLVFWRLNRKYSREQVAGNQVKRS
ncbi:MAG: hypothetical protein V1879_04925 [Pseudomonadota bacterium]